MKRITNILSYLWLLLLMAVTACSDLEEIVVNMQGEEEVELTIQTNIPSLGGSTRTAPTENITSITALAFDSDYELVKVVKATLKRDKTNGENNSTVGTMTIKVPVRTRRIHFIAKNNDEFTEITDADYGRTDIDLLKTLSSDELHYWQVVNFANKTNLQSFNNGAELKLIRNKARVYLTLPQDASMTGHIVGFLNYNTTGTIAASKNEAFGYVATGDNHEMPSTFLVASDSDPDANLGNEHYLFEEKNTKGADGFGEAADLVYVVCWIKKGDEAGKYYKIAFKSGESYYHIIRNLKYEIKISKDLDTTRGYANFADAVAKAPINDAGAKVQIHMNFNPDPLSILLDNDPETASSATTMITNFEGIQTLQIGYPQEFFGEGGVIINGYDTQPDVIEAKTPAGTDIWVVEYNVEGKTELELSVTLKDGIENAVKDIQIQFLGEGSEVFVDDILHANALQRGDLTITTSATKIPKVAGSQFTASVPVQSYAQDVGEYRLFIDDADDAFTITLPDGVRTLADGSYEVTNLAGSQAVFTFTLIDDGEAGDEHEISFDLYTDFHHFIGTTTVMLVEEEIVKEIVATPSANSLNYAGSSVEDLWVKVTIPKEVTTLTFASEHFAVMVAGSQGEYVDSGDGYAINHAENATETIVPFRIRLKDGVSGTAQFTFGGESDKQNVTVQSATGNITLNNNGDSNVRWQGNVPLNGNNYDAIVPLKYEWFESIAAGSKLNLEFNVTGGDTSWLEVFEIKGETKDDWTNHNFEELNDDNRYVATGNGNYTLSLTITDAILDAIKEYFRSDFLGETTIAMAIRGVGITLTKVSVVPSVVVPDQDVYEIWVNNSAWIGNSDADVAFFGYKTTVDNGFIKNESSPTRTDFYDTGANAHKQQAMVMGSDDSFTFTIPAGDSRWLTMLVAANSGTPSINLTGTLANGESWTTTAETNATKVDGTYNFGNGEIGTAGRLIRYELPAGTYTLQGSDAAAYLLYYMRVSKAKPEMTDVATDVTASNYTLAWSGGEWNNYTKINDTYFVDDDATTFTPTLTTYKGLTGVKLAASSSLNITTGKYSFSDNQGDGTAITYNEVTSNNNGSDNGDIAIKATVIGNESITYNAGTYALSGIAKVTDTEYKYAAFYDVLRLNTVGFTVKNTIKLGLYYSWNGDANTITEYVDGLPYIIGFRMPYSLPVAINADNDTSTPINFTIDSKWERRESGLGVICNAPNYQLASQQEGNSSNNRVHPRPEWTYKIEWYEVAANTIQPTTTDTDIYFSYGKDNSGNAYITKSPVIATTKSASEKLALTLDFSSNSENESTHTLNFGNDFYLRATISAEDANKYAGAHVRLQGVFSNNTQGGGNSAIHWTNSRKDGSIEYARNSSDGTQLQFEIKAGQTTYEIHWQFVRDDGSTTTPTQFTYTVDNDAYNITNGSESATIVLNGNGQVVDNPLSIELDFYADEDGDGNVDNQGNSFNNLLLNTSHVYLKAKISSEDAAKYDGKQVILTGTYPSQNAEIGGLAIHWVDSKKSGNNNYNIWYTNNTGESLQFNVHSGILEYLIEWVFVTGQHYKGGDIGFTYNISNYAISDVDGTFNNFAGDTSATIAFTNEPVIYCNFDNDIEGFYVSGKGSVERVNNALALSSNNDYNENDEPWAAQAMKTTDKIEYDATYTLTFKAKIADGTTGGLVVAIQRFVDNTNYTYYFQGKDINKIINAAQKDEQGWAEIVFDNNMNITTTDNANTDNPTHFMFNFGDINGTVYIDDLKLVRNNQ